MVIKNERNRHSTASSYSGGGGDGQRSFGSAIALKRYLDLTLRGTRKSLADHGNKGKKGHPLSPYTFDQPEIEKSVQRTLQTPDLSQDGTRPPNWVNEINSRVIKHNGEAPIFTENFLPSNKDEQMSVLHAPHSRPLSGMSTKSAPVIINGSMYQRQNKKHTFLQASRRPASAMEDRMTRAAKLRNKHRSQTMSGKPSDSTKDELQRIKGTKPARPNLNKDLLPIPCHNNETPHSFIIGARYNCSHFMDSRSFSRLGLYVPRKNPLGSFLKVYKGDETTMDSRSESEIFLEQTSVRTGGSLRTRRPFTTQPLGEHNARVQSERFAKPPIPAPRVRKVFKEAWLNTDENKTLQANARKMSITRSQSRSPVPPHPSPKPEKSSMQQKPHEGSKSSVERTAKRAPSQNRRARSTPAPFAHGRLMRESLIAHNAMLSKLHLPTQSSLLDSADERASAPMRVAETE